MIDKRKLVLIVEDNTRKRTCRHRKGRKEKNSNTKAPRKLERKEIIRNNNKIQIVNQKLTRKKIIKEESTHQEHKKKSEQ